LRPIVWQARALKRLGRLADAIGVLDDGLRTRGGTDDPLRRAAAYWNRACYKSLRDIENRTSESVTSVVDDLKRAVQDAPAFAKSLWPKVLDDDLASLVGHPIFESWREQVLGQERDRNMSDKKTF